MPFVAAALSDSAAEATTSAAGARTSAMRPNDRATRNAFMKSFLALLISALGQNDLWKRKPMLTSWNSMNSKLSSR
jgi:hypothetical protein